MSFKGLFDIVTCDTGSVIRDDYFLEACFFDFHFNSGTTSINRIFHQLFDDRSRSFHHFPRRNLVR